MHPHRTRRLIAAACLLAVVAAPPIWLACQFRQQKLNQALISAIKQSDANKVDSLLAAGADPNTRDMSAYAVINPLEAPGPGATTPLMAACGVDDPDCVRMLLDRGANPNPPRGLNVTLLSTVEDCQYKEVIKLLKAHGARE